MNIRPYEDSDAQTILSWCRNLGETIDELRFGFVIVNPVLRGRGYGKSMLQQGLKYAFSTCGASKASLGVFENNESAYYCYKAAGFNDVVLDKEEVYHILGQDWKCREIAILKMEIVNKGIG